MTDKITDGGPAFPCEAEWFDGKEVWPSSKGMTMRDWFAGQALSIVYGRFLPGEAPGTYDIAVQAYFIADAMLAERKHGGYE